MALNTPSQTLDNTNSTNNFTTKVVRASDTYSGLITFQITGIAGGATLTPQGTVDGTNYVTVGIVPVSSTTMATSITADGIYRADGSGLKVFRIAVTGAGTGTSTIIFFTTEG